jgi:hypothetical protein
LAPISIVDDVIVRIGIFTVSVQFKLKLLLLIALPPVKIVKGNALALTVPVTTSGKNVLHCAERNFVNSIKDTKR